MKNRVLSQEFELESIIKKCSYCTVSMVDSDGKPYAIPMNFGYHEKVLYLHSAPEGKKIDVLNSHPEVCVVFSTDHELRWQNSEVACSYSMKYRSVLLFGEVSFVDDEHEKVSALDVIMLQYTDQTYRFSAPAVKNVCVMKVEVQKLEGRAYGY